MIDESSLNDLKNKLITACRILDQQDLANPMGHISVRIPDTDTFLITRSIAPGMATYDDVLACNLQGEIVGGKHARTFGEVWAHIAVYRKRADIQSVAHTHSPYVVALSMTDTTLLPVSIEALKLGYDPIGFYRNMIHLQTLEIGNEVADLIGTNRAVVLKGHGALVVGKSIEETTVSCAELEKAAKHQVIATSTGKLRLMTPAEIEPVIRFFKSMDAQGGMASPYGRTWEYLKSRLK
jgi:ribulose-5-phosphate 4-epimerase/fuculose-1-phosphate aldolase